MLPKFLIAGIMKSGTTYVDNLVRRHPQIFMPPRSMKYSFFDNDKVFKNGVKWYESLFEGGKGDELIGQTSADCAFNPGSLERIKEIIPDVKLVFIVRDPIDRLYSLYWHQVKMGRECLSFERALAAENRRIRKSYYHFKMYSYVERSKYKRQFDRVYSIFSPSQVLVIPFERMVKNELEYLNRIFDFLGVSRIGDLGILRPHEIPRNPAMIPSNFNVVKISFALQRIGLVGVGRFMLNKNLVQKRPPEMSSQIRSELVELFREDLDFHQGLK